MFFSTFAENFLDIALIFLVYRFNVYAQYTNKG